MNMVMVMGWSSNTTAEWHEHGHKHEHVHGWNGDIIMGVDLNLTRQPTMDSQEHMKAAATQTQSHAAHLILARLQATPTARHKLCSGCCNGCFCKVQLRCGTAAATHTHALQPCTCEEGAPQAQCVAQQSAVQLAEQGPQGVCDVHDFLFKQGWGWGWG
jgi:hypothetical protein